MASSAKGVRNLASWEFLRESVRGAFGITFSKNLPMCLVALVGYYAVFDLF